MTDIYQYDCKLCGNKQELDHEDQNWLCMCQQKPQGSNWLHICSECNNHRWGSRNNVDCEVCFARKLTKKERSITVIPFEGMPVRKSAEDRMKGFEESMLRSEEIQNKIRQNKIDTNKAILSVPELLKDVNEKLDRILSKRSDMETDEDGLVVFGDKNVQ